MNLIFNIFQTWILQTTADWPPVDLHWFFEISIRTEKKFQLELKKKIQL